MIVLVVLGWILLGILALLLLLLALLSSLKLTLRAGYCQKLLLVLKIGPVTLDFSDSMGLSPEEAEEYTKKKKQKRAKAPAQPKKQKKKEKPLKYTEKPAMTAVISAFKDLVLGLLRHLGRHLKLEQLRLRVLVASPDAAQTALEYGAACAAAGLVRTAAEGLHRTDPRNMDIRVECDFLAETPEVDAEICISVRVWRLAVIALQSARPLMDALALLKAYKHFKQIEKTERNGNTHGNSNETTD